MLQRTGFLDSVATRSVIVSFTVFNIKQDLYISNNVLFEKGNGLTYRVTEDHSMPF